MTSGTEHARFGGTFMFGEINIHSRKTINVDNSARAIHSDPLLMRFLSS